MKCAIQIEEKNKRRWMIVSIIFAIVVAVICVGYTYSIRKRNIQIAEEERARQEEEQAVLWEEVEREYIEFEKLFRENEEDMQRFLELSMESILGEKEYVMFLDEKSYPSKKSPYEQYGWIAILYDNDTFAVEEDGEMAKVLNENDDLMEVLNSIKEKGVITGIDQIYINESKQIIFSIAPEFTPFITTNGGVSNDFVWCNDENCEIYGYKNVEDNWYMYIYPVPE